MVGTDGALPLPWLAAPLRESLRRRGHAFLVHGPEGVGQFELAVTLAQAWLCEAPLEVRLPGSAEAAVEPPLDPRPCGQCAGCRLVQARSHPDLLVLLPEALRESLGWTTGSAEAEEGTASKAKPSKEIKVDAVRAAVAFAQTTSARGRGKVVVLHPAERINAVASNTLLKTLEEPPGDARFLLSCSTADALLPTIRSRCQLLPLALPATEVAVEWLGGRGLADPATLLAACGGQPLLALQWAADGIDAKLWKQLPTLMARGDAVPFMNWPLPRLVDALQKLAHDVLSVAARARPRFFPEGALRSGPDVAALTAWSKSLGRVARDAEHPWSAGLLVETLVDEARRTLDSASESGRRPAASSLHSQP